MRLALSLAAVAVVFVLARPVAACLWDYDTLAAEAKGQMADVVHIIAGRFERNPSLYYEMRLKRAAARIAADPDDLAAYDDAGVAADRLGRGDEAIAWMEKKALRPGIGTPIEGRPQERADHRYRYLANVGTFWVHRWARNGADRSKIDEVKMARDFIARAIALNPNAHFGRETYQLKALDWIINPVHYGPPDGLSGFLDPANPANSTDATIRGLSGLIALGNGWESIDVFNTLGQALHRADQRNSVALLAALRADELIDAGRRSLDPNAPTDPAELKDRMRIGMSRGLYDRKNDKVIAEESAGPQNKEGVEATFAALRAEADAWHKARLAFMLPRLEAGRHPNTDPTFWQGYVEAPPPSIEAVMTSVGAWRTQAVSPNVAIRNLAIAAGLTLVATIATVAFLLHLIRRNRRKPVAQTSEF
jgi:hypothetical protein